MSLPLALIAAVGGAAALVTVSAREAGLLGRSRLATRARALATNDGMAAAVRRARRGDPTRLDQALQRWVPKPERLRERLDATGRPISFSQYGLACAAIAIVVAAIALTAGVPLALSLLEALASGLWLPHMALGFLAARRREAFLKLFPEAIGLMVRGLRAGLPIGETLVAVAGEVPPPLGDEFKRVVEQVRLGKPLEEALWRMAQRLGLPELNFLVVSLSVQRETGGNLAETLENLELIIRRRQQMRLKVRAMAAEGTASALIIGCLPFVMGGLMFVVSHDYLMLLFTTPAGRLLSLGAGISLAIGWGVMRKMIKFSV